MAFTFAEAAVVLRTHGTRGVLALTLVSLVFVSMLHAQAPARVVRGRVAAGDTGEPVVNARVSVTGTSRAVRTDVDGRFAIAVTPAATIVVTKSGFVQMNYSYTTDPQTVNQSIEITLVRAAVISGRVVDEFGDPVVSAPVRVTDATAQISGRAGRRATTDDQGRYRIGGLASGAYVVAISTQGSAPMTPSDRASQMPTVTFFPGTFDQKEALPVRVSAGEERAVDFRLTVAQSARQEYSVFPNIVSIRDLNIPRGTASVRGSVVSSDGRLITHAVVVLQDDTTSRYRVTIADDGGRYDFTAVPAGTYRVAASKAGYSMPSDGFTLPAFARAGTRVAIRTDDDRDRVDVTLRPWGAITGHVLDETGEPIAGASVGLLLSRYEGGRRRLVPARTPQRVTDDRGEFRIFAIPDGQYVLGASVNDSPTLDIAGYGQTYYPGTGSAGEGRFIAVGAGDDLTGFDFSLVQAATARITGKLVDAAGRPTTGGRFTLVPRSALAARIDSRIDADGTFEFINVPPGQYVIQADRGRLGGNVEGEFGAFPVTVNRSDVSGLTLRTAPGSIVKGRIVYQSATGAVPPPSSISISAIPADFDLAPPGLAVVEPDNDAHFELRGITGERRLQAIKLPPGWMLKSIVTDGRDVTDQLLEFGRSAQAIVSVEFALTDQVNGVTGTVTDNRGRRLAGVWVVVFSADRARWYPASRFVRSTETTEDGRFSVTGLPTGNFFVGAVVRVPSGDEAWRDPAFLDSIRQDATSISLGEGQTQAVNLRVSSR